MVKFYVLKESKALGPDKRTVDFILKYSKEYRVKSKTTKALH